MKISVLCFDCLSETSGTDPPLSNTLYSFNFFLQQCDWSEGVCAKRNFQFVAMCYNSTNKNTPQYLDNFCFIFVYVGVPLYLVAGSIPQRCGAWIFRIRSFVWKVRFLPRHWFWLRWERSSHLDDIMQPCFSSGEVFVKGLVCSSLSILYLPSIYVFVQKWLYCLRASLEANVTKCGKYVMST